MPREYGWDRYLQEICDRQAIKEKLPQVDIVALQAVFDRKPDPAIEYDWNYRNLNDFRHKQYHMEKNGSSKRKSSDSLPPATSSASLASSVPDDLRIATPPDESPQIKRRKSDANAGRETVSRLAERMKTFIEEFGRSYEQLKAAHEEIRLIAKTAEETNEKIAERMNIIEKKLQERESHILDAKRDISLLKKQFEFKAAAKSTGGIVSPAAVPKLGPAAVLPVKKPAAAPCSPASASLLPRKPSPPRLEDIPTVEWDDPYCARCNSDYKKGENHVCKM